MGDSWGKYYMEYALLRKKHTVFNESIYGGSNSYTLDNGIHFLSHTADFLKIDLIIWFQTEYIRDASLIQPTSDYEFLLEQIHDCIYEKIIKIRSLSPNSEWAVIGGHAPLYKTEKFNWANFIKPDWRSELLGKPLPATQSITHSMLNILSKDFRFDISLLTDELKKYEIILDEVLKRPDIFHDNVHPSAISYEDLWSQISTSLNIED